MKFESQNRMENALNFDMYRHQTTIKNKWVETFIFFGIYSESFIEELLIYRRNVDVNNTFCENRLSITKEFIWNGFARETHNFLIQIYIELRCNVQRDHV